MVSKSIYRIILLGVSLGLIATAQTTQPADRTASCLPRLGNEIDHDARDYFHLFPAITDFDHAFVTCDSSRAATFRIFRQGKTDTVVRLDAQLTRRFSMYLRAFEHQQLSATWEYPEIVLKQMRKLFEAGIVDTGRSDVRFPGFVKITSRRDGSVKGFVLHADDDCVILVGDIESAVKDNFSDCIFLPTSNIREIQLKAPGDARAGFWRGFGKGLLISTMLVSVPISLAGSSHNSGTDYLGAAGGAFVGGLYIGLPVGVIAGAVNAWMTAEGSLTATVPVDSTKAYIVSLKNSAAFPGMLPPELEKSYQDYRRKTLLAQPDESYEGNKETQERNKPLPFSLDVSYGWHIYPIESRSTKVWLGAELSKEWELAAAGNPKFNLAACIGAGWPYVAAQAAVKILMSSNKYLLCGLRYQPEFDDTDLGSSGWGGEWGNLQRAHLLQNMSILAGYGSHSSGSSFEIQASLSLEPSVAVVRQQSPSYRYGSGGPYELFMYRFFSVSLRWGFDL